MADHDDEVDAEGEFEAPDAEDVEPEEIDAELDPEDLDGDDDGEFVIEPEFDEDADGAAVVEGDEEEDESAERAGPARRAVPSEDEDEDDDLLAPDDVEADLDTILKDRMVAADDESDDDEEEPEERGEAADRLQPKRADEQLCPSCFLLVRHSAPVCPVAADDDCPLFG